MAANAIGMNIGALPIKYLGLLIGANMCHSKNWKPIVDVFDKWLSKWKGRSLSIGGRLTLIQSVLSSLPLYYFSIFRAPHKVLHQLEKIRRRFLWSGNAEEKKIN